MISSKYEKLKVKAVEHELEKKIHDEFGNPGGLFEPKNKIK